MARKGENIYKRKDGRWEGRYIKSRSSTGKANYGYVYAKSYREVKAKLISQSSCTSNSVTVDPEIRELTLPVGTVLLIDKAK